MKKIIVLLGLFAALTAGAAEAKKKALVCGDLYFETADVINDWRGEVRDKCYYSNFCYFHGRLFTFVRPDSRHPNVVRISFEGSAKLRMDHCGRLFCTRERIGTSYYGGELVLNLDTAEGKYEEFLYSRKDLWGKHGKNMSGQSVKCEWKDAWKVID